MDDLSWYQVNYSILHIIIREPWLMGSCFRVLMHMELAQPGNQLCHVLIIYHAFLLYIYIYIFMTARYDW